MNRCMGLRTSCILGMLLYWTAIPVFAGPPTVALSLKSIDELLDDADCIGEAVGQPGLKGLAQANIEGLTGGPAVDGIDRDRPLGFYWTMVESDPNNLGILVVYIPVTDNDNFEKLVRKFAPNLKVDGGKWTMSVQGIPLYATISDEYCFITTSSDGLEELADPEKLADDNYDISVVLNVTSIPQQTKDMYLSLLEQQARKNLAERPEPKSEAEAKGRELGVEGTLATIKALVVDGDKVTFGIDVDTESRLASLDLTLTGKPRSPLGNALVAYGKTVPAFAAVASDSAPFRFVASYPTTALLAQLDVLFDGMRSTAISTIESDPKLTDEGDKKAAKDVANRLFSIAQATVKSGSLHSVIVLEEGDNETTRLIAGTKVAKGDDAGKLWDDILKLSKESPDLAKVKTDVAKHAGARIHSIAMDLNNKNSERFGEDPAHLAIRADSLWLSMGGGNLEALKNALDLSGKKGGKSEPPISLRVKPATLVTIMENDDKELIKRAEAIAGEDGDLLNFEIEPTDDTGVKVHLEFGIDLFKLSGN